jgi:hypothetical protein
MFQTSSCYNAKEVLKPVRNPLGDKSSGDTRKLPAAPFTRISILPKCLNADSRTLFASSCLRTSPSNPAACRYHSKMNANLR